MTVKSVLRASPIPLFTFFGLMLSLSVSAASSTSDDVFYTPHDNPEVAVETARKRAIEEDKYLLLMIGATWCHDSDALAEHFGGIRDTDVIQNHFVVTTIDAGWLADLSSVLSLYGHPGYFGTPTLLIIDPATKQVMNRDSVQRWQSAHGESTSSLLRYFELELESAKSWQPVDIPLELATYEAEQTQRLYEAYKIIGPLLEDEVVNGNVGPLDNLWNEVRRFRYQLQHDLVEAHRNPDADRPIYPALSFETR